MRGAKGIDAIISVILLLMISVALVATAYTWFSDVTNTVTAGGTNVTEQAITVVMSSMVIENVNQNIIYIRNNGGRSLTGFAAYVNEQAVGIDIAEPVAVNAIVTLTLKDYAAVAKCSGNIVRITTAQQTTATVSVNNLISCP